MAAQRPMRGVVAVAVACVTGMAGVACAGSGGDPLASMSAKQVLSKAVSDLKAAPTFGLSGTVGETGGETTLHLDFKRGAGCKGTINQGVNGSFTVVVIGTTAWVRPNDTFWRALAVTGGQQATAPFRGRYVKGSTTNAIVASLTGLCDVNSMVSQLSLPTDVVKGKVTTLDGKQVLPLTDKLLGGMLYVTDTSSPQIVELVDTTAGKDVRVIFTMGIPVTLTAPPASQSVDGSSIGF